MVTELKRMRQRYDTAANFTSGNPTLLAGEIGIESDTNNMKVGDGSTAWTSLAYASIGVTARDTATGQLQIGGVEMGDTGWRAIASWTGGTQDASNQLATINTATFTLAGDGRILARRTGDIISYAVEGSFKVISAGTIAFPFTTNVIPSGFQWGPVSLSGVATHNNGGTYVRLQRQAFGYDVRVHTLTANTELSGVLFGGLPAINAWPSSLPGTAA